MDPLVVRHTLQSGYSWICSATLRIASNKTRRRDLTSKQVGLNRADSEKKPLLVAAISLFCFAGLMSSCSVPDQDAIAFPSVELPTLPDLTDVDPELAEYMAERHDLVLEHPTSASERGRLAMTYDANGWSKEAIRNYDQAHVLDPYEFTWPYFAALLEASVGNFEDALDKLEKALAIDDEYVAGWLWKGTWLVRLDRLEAAKTAFEKAYSVDGSIHAIVGKAHAMFRSGDSTSAIDLLEPLLNKTMHPQIFRLLGQAYEDLRHDELARVAHALGKDDAVLLWQDPLVFRREQHIRGFGGRRAKAQRLLQARRVEEALIELSALRDQYSDRPSLTSTLAWAYSVRGETDLAIEALQIGIEELPTHQPYYTQLGDLLSMMGNYEVALGLLQESVELNDSDSEARIKLGFVLMQLDRMDEAMSEFQEALDLGSESTVDVYVHMGTVEGYRKNWEEATMHFKNAIDLDPRNVVAHERLCLVYIETGQFKELDGALKWAAQMAIPAEELAFVFQYRDEVLGNSEDNQDQ